MFKQFVVLGIVAGIGASIASVLYASFYFENIVDFSSALGFTKMISTSFMVTMIACFLNAGARMLIKNKGVADFLFNLIFALCSIAFVFLLLKADDPVFKDDNISIFVEYYKGFVMPMLFFPALSWFTFKPLIVKL